MSASTTRIRRMATVGGRCGFLLAATVAVAGMLATPLPADARGAGGGGRMATASVATANRAAGVAPGRPAVRSRTRQPRTSPSGRRIVSDASTVSSTVSSRDAR